VSSREQTPEEPRYTLKEAERELAKRECGIYGHTFDVTVTTGSGNPRIVVCTRCSRTWTVQQDPEARKEAP
jgi:hypothetical protein